MQSKAHKELTVSSKEKDLYTIKKHISLLLLSLGEVFSICDYDPIKVQLDHP